MSAMHRLLPEQIQINKPLPWNVFDNGGHLLLRKGFIVQGDGQVDALIERGMYVNAAEFSVYEPAVLAANYDALSIWESVQAHMAYLFEAMPQDGSLQNEITQQARQVLLLCDRSPDLALAAIMLMDMRNYPIAHSLHTSIIASLVARRAGWNEADRLRLCCASLSMNVAMIRLQLQLCNQRDPLAAEQRRMINEHPAEGARQLIICGVNDDEWLRAVLEHHETPDGQGYPRKVKNPSEMAMLIHTADVFCAKVSPRAHRKPMVASEATRTVFTKLAHDGKNSFPALLVKEIGIYPPGSIVKLANGEVGTVQKRGASAKTPVVAVLINPSGLPVLKPVIRNTAEEGTPGIAAVMSREHSLIGLNFEQIWNTKSSK